MVKDDSIHQWSERKCDKKSFFPSFLIIFQKPEAILFRIHAESSTKEIETIKTPKQIKIIESNIKINRR